MQVCVIRHTHMLNMLIDNNPDSIIAVRSIGHWLSEMGSRRKSERFLCMDCDTTFHDRWMPDAFMVVTPFAATSGHAIVTGICRLCANRDDAELRQVAFNSMRQLYPHATAYEPPGRPT